MSAFVFFGGCMLILSLALAAIGYLARRESDQIEVPDVHNYPDDSLTEAARIEAQLRDRDASRAQP